MLNKYIFFEFNSYTCLYLNCHQNTKEIVTIKVNVMGTLAHCHFILATSKLDTDPPPLWLRDENPYSDLLSIVMEHPSIKLITNPETCFSRKSSYNAVFDVVEMEKYPVPLDVIYRLSLSF